MKYLFLCLFLTFSSLSIGQDILVKVGQPISQGDELFFYGYDISHVKVTDPKRIGQKLSWYLLHLVRHLTDDIKDETLK